MAGGHHGHQFLFSTSPFLFCPFLPLAFNFFFPCSLPQKLFSTVSKTRSRSFFVQSFFSIFLALVSVCLVHIPYLLSKLPCSLISFLQSMRGVQAFPRVP